MIALISSIASAIGSFFNWKSSKTQQHKAAKSLVEREEADKANRKAAINRAVHSGDTDAVNDILAIGIALLGFAVLGGCASSMQAKRIYVASDRKVTVITNATGVVGWFVPNLVMEELLNSKVELEECRKSIKIKEITK